jgi:hypothetical protein
VNAVATHGPAGFNEAVSWYMAGAGLVVSLPERLRVPCEDGGSLQNMRRLIVSTCEALILGIPRTEKFMLPVPDFA